MDFSLNETERQLSALLEGYFARQGATTGPGRFSYGHTSEKNGSNSAIWQGLTSDLGVVGLLAPEQHGGLGASITELLIVMDALGHALIDAPYLDTAVKAVALLSSLAECAPASSSALLEAISAGKAICAVALPCIRGETSTPRAEQLEYGWRLSGACRVVPAAQFADSVIIIVDHDSGQGIVLLDRATCEPHLNTYPTIDGRSAADIDLDGLVLPKAAMLSGQTDASDIVMTVQSLARAALGAEAVGIMRRMLADTRDFCLERHQFGQPIARFQVLQHRLVDMYLHLELATSAVYRAMLSLEGPEKTRLQAVAAMSVTLSEALKFIGQNAIQLHGGMGMTDEMSISRYFRRATAIELELGNLETNVRAFADLRPAA